MVCFDPGDIFYQNAKPKFTSVGGVGEDPLDTSGNVTGSDFEEDPDEAGQLRFSELLSDDTEKDDSLDQDPPSSTTGDHNDKPSKRSNQGESWPNIVKRCLLLSINVLSLTIISEDI